MKRTLLFLVLFCAALAAVGQTAAGNRDRRNPPPSDGQANAKPAATANSPTSPVEKSSSVISLDSFALGDYVMDDKHKLLPGDRLAFKIAEDRTNAIPLVVADSTELEIPYLGRVSVAGKTCKQAAEDIKTALEKDYYYKVTVVIGLDILARVPGKVYVSGPVRNPGFVEIPINETFTLSKAILRAGGFGDFANRKKVQIIRKAETGTKTILVNMENVFVKGHTEEDVTLEPEDFIIVPQRSINW